MGLPRLKDLNHLELITRQLGIILAVPVEYLHEQQAGAVVLSQALGQDEAASDPVAKGGRGNQAESEIGQTLQLESLVDGEGMLNHGGIFYSIAVTQAIS